MKPMKVNNLLHNLWETRSGLATEQTCCTYSSSSLPRVFSCTCLLFCALIETGLTDKTVGLFLLNGFDVRVALTHNHDVKLKTLLHGLPPHLLQDGIDAHVAEVAAMGLLPLTLRTGVVGLGGLRHVAVAHIDV